jgi:hypothetical protein
MHDLSTVEIPKLANGAKFEELCRDLWRNDDANERVDFNGGPGQGQQGVDVFGRNKKTREWFGIQCKVRKEGNPLTKEIIVAEIREAMGFNPELRTYFVCTTLNRSAKLQQIEREILQINPALPFDFKIVFWEDIVEMLSKEANLNVFQKHYAKLLVNSTALGFALGKLVNLELGEGARLDTHYEIMVGKIPKYKDREPTDVDYFRGVYFIVNLNEKRMATFPQSCHPSDLEQAFSNPYDRSRVARWLGSIKDLDAFIYDGEYSVDFHLTKKEIAEIRARLRQEREDD